MKCEGSAGSLLVESHWCYTSAIGEQSDNLVHRQTRLLSFPQGITDDTFRNITTSPLGACLPLLRMESSTCGSSSPFRESLTHTNPRTPRAHGYMHAGNNITISSPACPKWQPDSSKKQKTSHTPQRRCAFCLFEHYYLFAITDICNVVIKGRIHSPTTIDCNLDAFPSPRANPLICWILSERMGTA